MQRTARLTLRRSCRPLGRMAPPPPPPGHHLQTARLLVLASLLALLGMVTLAAAVAIKRRRIEMVDEDSPTALTVQTWVQIADGDFDVPIAAATTSAPEMPDSYQGWVRHLAPNIQPAYHLVAENPMIPPDTPLSKGCVLRDERIRSYEFFLSIRT